MVVKSGTKGKTLIVDFISKAGYSIRNALICSKYGREVPSPRSACNDMFHKLRSQFISKNTLRFFSGSYNSMDVFQAQCLNVKDPYNFYIIKEENKLSLDNLTSEMEEYFNKIRPRHLYSIEIDLPCTLKPDGAWARGKIIRFDDDIIIVKLVDEGRILPTKWSELYELPEEFLKLNESAIECSLIHVEPLDGFGAQWDRASVEEFKKITTGGYFEVKIVEKSRSTYKIILVSVQNQLNINALFCAQGFANSTGKHSAVDILPEKLKTTSRDIVEAKMDLVPKRSNIIISHYCNPGEFYLQCESHLVKIAEFQKNIHSEMNILRQMKKVVRIEKPEVGDMCMVHDKLDSKPMKQWFRAQFKTKVEAKYCVFLVDYGNILYTSKVFEIPSAFESVARGAVKCHLACIKPTGNLSEWPACSIDFLRDCTVKYRNLSASKTDSCPCGNSSSTCTFLWGISEESKGALSALQTQWININKELFKEGYAHKTADMLLETFFDYNFNLPIDKSPFEDWKKIELKLKSENTFSDDNHNKVHLEGPIVMKAKLNHYISPKMISKTVFTGYPTYVDHEAIIYLHDDEGKKFIEQINSNVEEFLNSLEWKNHELNNSMNRFSNSEDWEPGQACLARFHFDNKYYRAEIVSLMENDLIQVRFVDYGNVEECGYSDLLGITVYPNVPIQAHKYKFYGIKPVNTQSHHENHVLDTMHKMVVEKICQIRVENKTTSSNSSSTFSYPMSKDDPQFLMCSVKVDNNIDVVDYLLQKEMVECTDSAREKLLYEKKSISGIYNRNEELFNGKGSSANIVNKTDPFDENRDFIIKHEEIQSIFIRQQMEEIVNLSMEDNKSKPNDDVVELDSSYVSRYWERKSKLYKEFGSEDEEEEPSYDCFNPSDTSSSKFNNGIGPYIFRKFHRKHSKFECEVHSVETSTIVSINPLIDEFINEFVKVQKSIAEVVGRTPLLEGLKKGQACLARHLDGKWYRGYIESVPQPGLYAKVILVDIMSLQEISREYLKVIPASFLNIPLRCSRVELSGVQPNGRLRNKLITETLTNILVKDYKTMFAVITNYNSRYPKVKLYTDETCTTLVYHQMILDQMFNI
ncbi:RNF17 family protein [Megaselia abdita]